MSQAGKLQHLRLAAAQSSCGRLHAPRQLLARLHALAALLREAPPGGTAPRLLWRDEGRAVRAQPLDAPRVVGRDGRCDVVLASPRVSRRHCRFALSDEGCQIEDLGSANGTWVNGVRVIQSRLRDGDLVEIGGVCVAFLDST